jgi:SAM-dependent methyltransferase
MNFTLIKNVISQFKLLLLGLIFLASPLSAQDLDVPYVPTPHDVVERMLDLADVQPSDYVIDLGSGDGRIIIAAAKRGASGHGVDLDPERITEARENAIAEGVDNQIMFMQDNIFDTDFSKASVITMYLLPSINEKLRPDLLEKLEPGTKIVSHSFDMGDWTADEKETITSNNMGNGREIYFWIIPADVHGTWQWSSNDAEFSMTINQKFQEITVDLTNKNEDSYTIEKAELRGKRLTIRGVNGDQTYIFSGRVEGDNITGLQQHHNGNEKKVSDWSASRN